MSDSDTVTAVDRPSGMPPEAHVAADGSWRNDKGHMVAGSPRPAGAGRPKGLPNKVTADVRSMVNGALAAVGGIDYLKSCALSEDASVRVAFLSLVRATLPKNVNVEVGRTLAQLITGSWPDVPDGGVGGKPGAVDVDALPVVEQLPPAD